MYYVQDMVLSTLHAKFLLVFTTIGRYYSFPIFQVEKLSLREVLCPEHTTINWQT